MISAVFSTTRFRRLHKVLDEERETLLKGRLGELDRIAARKEAAIAELNRQADDLSQSGREGIDELRKKLERNRRLLAASREGIASAREQIRKAAGGAAEFTTYTASGMRKVIGEQRVSAEKRR